MTTSQGVQIVPLFSNLTSLPAFPLFCAYLLMILLSGVYQKFTRPVELRKVLVAYNFLCTSLSVYTLLGFAYGLSQAPHLYYRGRTAALETPFTVYFAVKVIELLDTVFMLLRHKSRQISFLHVFHHSSMLLLSDYSRQYAVWPAIAPVLALNSAVHVVLYLYYGLTALNPTNPPQWKRRVTEFQIIQFFIDLVYATIGYLYHGFCIYGIFYGLAMIYLFTSFYYSAYLRRRPKKE